ncbi:MAG: TadG family pilus assembly protein [Defluviicoccus sp.]
MAPMLAFGVVVGVSAAAVGVDLVRGRALQQSLHMAADAAALAAAARLPDMVAATEVALAYVEKNMSAADYGRVLDPRDVEFGAWDPKARTFTVNTSAATAVRITTRLSAANENATSTFFAGILGQDSIEVAANAVAGRTGAPCVIALDPTAAGAMDLGYDSTLEARGCGIQVNSTSGRALMVASEASLESADTCIGGMANVSGSVSPEPREYCPGQADPLAGLANPSYGSCEYNKKVYQSSSQTLSPGIYCGGVTIEKDSKINLSPGLYVIKDGALKVLDTSSISGTEVTIFLTGAKAFINFNDESSVNLKAPTTGDYRGILLFQDPASSNQHTWNGQSTSLVGVIHLPSSELKALTNHLITPYRSCTVLITKTLDLNSGAGISIDLSGPTCRQSLPAPYQRGVVLLD